MSTETASHTIGELLHANPTLEVRRDALGILRGTDGKVIVSLTLERFQNGGDHSLLITARHRSSNQERPYRNDQSYLRISEKNGVTTAEHLYPHHDDIPAVSSKEMVRFAKATAAVFHLYQGMPEGYRTDLTAHISDEMQTDKEIEIRVNDQLFTLDPLDYAQAQAEYAYQILHNPLPHIASRPNIPNVV